MPAEAERKPPAGRIFSPAKELSVGGGYGTGNPVWTLCQGAGTTSIHTEPEGKPRAGWWMWVST
jgi:hypothetical protein